VVIRRDLRRPLLGLARDEIFVHVNDQLTGESFELEPPKDSALAAFYHPYALRPFGEN
jgi:hypothetical protein